MADDPMEFFGRTYDQISEAIRTHDTVRAVFTPEQIADLHRTARRKALMKTISDAQQELEALDAED